MADDLWTGATQAPAYLRVKKAPRARASDFDRTGGAMLRDTPSLAVARDPVAFERARRKRAEAIRAAGGQTIEAYRPGYVQQGYDAIQNALAGVYQHGFGEDERSAVQHAAGNVENIKTVPEGLIGLSEMENSARNIAAGEGGLGDYVNAGLMLAPELSRIPGVRQLAVRGASAVAARAPEFLKTAARYMVAPSRRFSVYDDVLGKGAQKIAAPQAPPKGPLAIVGPDDAEWDLHDLDFDVPITFGTGVLKAPATAAPPRGKIEAYHGTPHRFEPEVKVRNVAGEELYMPRPAELGLLPPELEVVKDLPHGRFRSDRMGTGAGAQMYGAGSYAAEAPNVARTYRMGNSAVDAAGPTIGGVDATRMYLDTLARADQLPGSQGQPLYDRAALLEELLHRGDTLDVEQALARDPSSYSPEAAEWFRTHVAGKWDAPGALYKLDLNVDPDKMLAWNSPLSEQPRVLDAIKPLMQRYDIPETDLYEKYPLTGGDIYHQLSFRSDIRPHAMSDMLRGAGLSGVRYVDTGSGPYGTSTQNYVVMDPDLIDIVKRYSAGGAVEGNEA